LCTVIVGAAVLPLVRQEFEEFVVGFDTLAPIAVLARWNNVRYVIVTTSRKWDSVFSLQQSAAFVAVVAAVIVHLPYESPDFGVQTFNWRAVDPSPVSRQSWRNDIS
jgi:hypothetical protein